jgi:uncharacterized protein (DUF1778 family)
MATKKASKRLDLGPPEVVRRKPDDARKGLMLRVRVTAEQKRLLTAAAEKSGLDVSSWLRTLGIERARAIGVD